ncbi:MAG: 3-oxoacyl-ACP reductase family protein [Dehalococcoidia bacterium]
MIPKEFSLEGKVAIVTGAGRGIGKAIALVLAEAGADITVAARTKEQIEQTAEEVRKLGRKALAIPTDVTQEAQVRRAVEQTLSQFGRIDILVNNAGGGESGPIAFIPGDTTPADWEAWARRLGSEKMQMTPEDWRLTIDTNLTSVFLFAQAVGPHMMKQKGGKVINITSMYATMGVPYAAAYCASKAGLVGFNRCLAAEWAPFNIHVNAIGPGMIKTEMTDIFWEDPDLWREYAEAIPLKRMGEAREVALLALYLASDASSYMTGQTLYLDGGQTARGNERL